MILISNSGGHQHHALKEFTLDTLEDLDNLPIDVIMGCTAFVISTGEVYMINSSHEWVKI